MLTWRFITVTIAGLAYFSGWTLLYPILPRFVEDELGGTGTAVGLAVGSFGITAAMLRPVAGRLGDRYGRRVLVVGGMLIVALSLLGYLAANSVAAVVGLRLLFGAGEAFVFVGLATAIQDMATDDRRGEAANYFSLAVYGGVAAGPPIGEWLFAGSQYDRVWLVAAAMVAVGAVLGLATPSERSTGAGTEPGLLHREALAMHRKLLGNEHLEVATSLGNLGLLLQYQGDYERAEPLQRESLALARKLLGDDHPNVATGLNNLALTLYSKGDYEEAEPLQREALSMHRKLSGNKHQNVAWCLNNLGLILQGRGDYEGAEQYHAESVLVFRQAVAPNHWGLGNAQSNYGAVLTRLNRFGEAEGVLLAAYPMLEAAMGKEHERTQKAIRRLIDLYEAWGKPEQAAEYRALLDANASK